MKIFYSIILASLMLASCNSSNQVEKTQDKKIVIVPDYDGASISLNQAIEKGYVSISANGQGTFTKLEVNVENLKDFQLNIEINSGLNFNNPNPEEQSLITTEKIGLINIQPNKNYKQITPTVCTNVNLHIPSEEKGWSNNLINDSRIDEILEVYGNYKPQITNWLRKKNPEKFTSEENQQSFLQVLVWAYTGGEYKEILEMLAKDVYDGDINKAKQWLDGIYDQAKLISEYVKNKDYSGLLIYIGLNDKVENFMKKNENTINNVKGRLKGLLSN